MSQYHGLFLINKPSGITSHDLVSQGRRVFKTKEVGHSGTLDPLASGLMILLLGNATKLSQYVMDGDKAYRAEILLGLKTDTLDVTGKTLEEAEVTSAHIQNIPQAIQSLEGEFEWPVPMYSAVKVQGQKLYEIARSDKPISVEVPKKAMKFWNLKQLSENGPSFWVDMECSKGSFVRTWIEKIGEKIGSGAAMKSLIRTGSSPFRLEQALTLEQTNEQILSGVTPQNFVPMNWALPHLKKARVTSFDQNMLLNGQISHDLRRQLIGLVDPEVSCMVQIMSLKDENLLALIAYEKGQGFKIKRVIASRN